MMSMTFEASSSVTLLFDFWDVHGPVGMVLSVLVISLLTVLYEVLKVLKVWLGNKSTLAEPDLSPPSPDRDYSSSLERTPSESSVTPIQPPPPAPSSRNRWLLHGVQTVLHMLQVSLGYMLMLCVMTYNVWIFVAVIVGSVLGYFISFPLLDHI